MLIYMMQHVFRDKMLYNDFLNLKSVLNLKYSRESEVIKRKYNVM